MTTEHDLGGFQRALAPAARYVRDYQASAASRDSLNATIAAAKMNAAIEVIAAGAGLSTSAVTRLVTERAKAVTP